MPYLRNLGNMKYKSDKCINQGKVSSSIDETKILYNFVLDNPYGIFPVYSLLKYNT